MLSYCTCTAVICSIYTCNSASIARFVSRNRMDCWRVMILMTSHFAGQVFRVAHYCNLHINTKAPSLLDSLFIKSNTLSSLRFEMVLPLS